MSNIDLACKYLAQGKMVIIQDHQNRENEGDLVCHAQQCSAQQINFMTLYGRGMICLALSYEKTLSLALSMQPTRGNLTFQSPFTTTIDASTGVTTGISPADRAHTIRTAAASDCPPEALATPGHIFPLRAHPEGLHGRQGHTEASIELMRLAGLSANAVICEIIDQDGQMARQASLTVLSKEFDIPFVHIDEICQAMNQVGEGHDDKTS